MVGPGDIAPAALSMACVSNIARGRFEPQRLLGALSKGSGGVTTMPHRSRRASFLKTYRMHRSWRRKGSDNAGGLMLIHKARSTVLLGAGYTATAEMILEFMERERVQ